MRVYAIIVIQKSTGNMALSSEAYKSLSDAEDFIKSRSDSPEQISHMIWSSDILEYRVHELNIK